MIWFFSAHLYARIFLNFHIVLFSFCLLAVNLFNMNPRSDFIYRYLKIHYFCRSIPPPNLDNCHFFMYDNLNTSGWFFFTQIKPWFWFALANRFKYHLYLSPLTVHLDPDRLHSPEQIHLVYSLVLWTSQAFIYFHFSMLSCRIIGKM